MKFQKLLCDLRDVGQQNIIDVIIENIHNIYAIIENYRLSNYIEPTKRNFVKQQFINKSNELKIKDLSNVIALNYTGENFNLFKIKLIKWKSAITKDVLLKFSYFINVSGGFPRVFKKTCIFPEILETMDVEKTDVETMDVEKTDVETMDVEKTDVETMDVKIPVNE